MSHVYYSTRLVWYGRDGVAKLHGRVLELTGPPQLPGLEVECIDYIPEIQLCRVQPARYSWRDLTADEIRSADALLRELVGA